MDRRLLHSSCSIYTIVKNNFLLLVVVLVLFRAQPIVVLQSLRRQPWICFDPQIVQREHHRLWKDRERCCSLSFFSPVGGIMMYMFWNNKHGQLRYYYYYYYYYFCSISSAERTCQWEETIIILFASGARGQKFLGNLNCNSEESEKIIINFLRKQKLK
jgi:hypothetical protein